MKLVCMPKLSLIFAAIELAIVCIFSLFNAKNFTIKTKVINLESLMFELYEGVLKLVINDKKIIVFIIFDSDLIDFSTTVCMFGS